MPPQPNGLQDLQKLHLNFKGEACAFCLGNIGFLSSPNRIHLTIHQILQVAPDSHVVGRVFLKYRTQKNGSNGEECQLTWNHSTTVPCHVTSMMHIVYHSIRLIGIKSECTGTITAQSDMLPHHLSNACFTWPQHMFTNLTLPVTASMGFS